MKKIVLFLFVIFLSLRLFSQGGWRTGEMEVEVTVNNEEQYTQLREIARSYDVYQNGRIRAYLTKEEYQQAKKAGLDTRIIIEDLNTYSQNNKANRDAYHNYYETKQLADSLCLNFPSICKKIIYGSSVNGRELAALKISDHVGDDENEAEVMFDGGIHGDELMCSELVIRFARFLCLNYGPDPYITNLINNREIWLYYMVNPDGKENNSRYNQNGVDLNRDWGFMWDAWGNSPGYYSQMETKALRTCMLSNQFVIHTTYHSGTEYVSYPWSYRSSLAPDHDHIDFLAALYSSSSGYVNLEYGQGNTGMYAINGSSKDSNYGIMGSVSWSMEISNQKQLPASQIMTYYNYNEPAMLNMIEYAGYGIEGCITDANTGDPVAAIVLINDSYPCYTDPEVGDFHKFLIPGTYSVKLISNSYESLEINNISVSDQSSTVLNLEMNPAEGSYIYKFVASQIPNNNPMDEGNTVAVYGAPDSVNYSIGKNGWVILDMQKNISDGPGNDITVYEGDDSPEGFSIYISQSIDGPWQLLGNGNGTSEFDISTISIPPSQFLKIQDDNDGQSNIGNAGFDLDAIKIATAPGQVVNPTPADNANNVEPWTDLDWEQGAGGFPANYVLYLGTDYPPTNIADSLVLDNAGYNPENNFDFDTEYFWQVSANNSAGSTQGEIWSFNTIRAPDEGFESGDFLAMGWRFDGDEDWIIENNSNNVFYGNYAAKSGTIAHNESSSLKISVEIISAFNSAISFRKKTSSEAGDKLEFYIDGELIDSWSGPGMFTKEEYPVEEGIHEFEWKYIKDESGSLEDDCAWIDHIYFPALAPPTVFAGNDTTACATMPIELCGNATNYNSLEWTTEGSGLFSEPYELHTSYSPSEEDYSAGQIGITLSITAGEDNYSDGLLLAFADMAEADAGPEQTICEGQDMSLDDANASNYSSVLWSTEGDGTFNDSSLIKPVYTPGPQDIASSSVNISLTAYGQNPCPEAEDEMLLTIISIPGQPVMPIGPDTVNIHLSPQSQYLTTKVEYATDYIWQLLPEEAGDIVSNDTIAIISWNQEFLGDVSLTVEAMNDCGTSSPSAGLSIYIENETGINKAIDKEGLTIYPNPNHGSFIMKWPENIGEKGTIKIFNLQGVCIYENKLENIKSGYYTIKSEGIPKGAYLLVLRTNTNRLFKSFLAY